MALLWRAALRSCTHNCRDFCKPHCNRLHPFGLAWELLVRVAWWLGLARRLGISRLVLGLGLLRLGLWIRLGLGVRVGSLGSVLGLARILV